MNMGTTATLRLDETEKAIIQNYASSKGMTMSEFMKKIVLDYIEDEYDLKIYKEYLKEKDNYDFFVKLYINALAGSQEAFKGFLLLDNLETVDRFSATHDFINDKTTVYKLPNNEFFAEHFSRKFDLYDDTFETEYKEFYFVIPVEKTITEWKKEH